MSQGPRSGSPMRPAPLLLPAIWAVAIRGADGAPAIIGWPHGVPVDTEPVIPTPASAHSTSGPTGGRTGKPRPPIRPNVTRPTRRTSDDGNQGASSRCTSATSARPGTWAPSLRETSEFCPALFTEWREGDERGEKRDEDKSLTISGCVTTRNEHDCYDPRGRTISTIEHAGAMQADLRQRIDAPARSATHLERHLMTC